MKIVNKKKFARSMILVVFFTSFIAITLSSQSLSHTYLSYKEKYVSEGETLWKIATEEKIINSYYTNKDVREIISDLKKINNLTTSNLQIGQRLEIPTI